MYPVKRPSIPNLYETSVRAKLTLPKILINDTNKLDSSLLHGSRYLIKSQNSSPTVSKSSSLSSELVQILFNNPTSSTPLSTDRNVNSSTIMAGDNQRSESANSTVNKRKLYKKRGASQSFNESTTTQASSKLSSPGQKLNKADSVTSKNKTKNQNQAQNQTQPRRQKQIRNKSIEINSDSSNPNNNNSRTSSTPSLKQNPTPNNINNYKPLNNSLNKTILEKHQNINIGISPPVCVDIIAAKPLSAADPEDIQELKPSSPINNGIPSDDVPEEMIVIIFFDILALLSLNNSFNRLNF